MLKHFTRIQDLGKEGAFALVRRALEMKRSGFKSNLLSGKTAVLLFEKASTRTRMSFEMAVRHLGGSTIFMSQGDSQLGRAEPMRDTIRVLSRYVDLLVIRTFGQERIEECIKYGGIPVVNALTDQSHPCQVLSDVLTMYERTPDLAALRVAWIGDGNNVAASWVEAAMCFPFEMTMSFPGGYAVKNEVIAAARGKGARISIFDDPKQAAAGAHYVNSDVWASMGQEAEAGSRGEVFQGFCVDAAMMALAAPGAKFMHCLPAHRGEEVTDEIMESPISIVWDQAENRLHTQKAILEWVFS